jgi:hypothetical protein
VVTDLIAYIAQALVDHPESVQVTERETGDTSVFELRVAPDDLGKVIGRQGRTARALRVVLQAAATKHRRRTVLEIVE